MFYPYVTISAAQARKSDDLHHAMSPFSNGDVIDLQMQLPRDADPELKHRKRLTVFYTEI